MLRVENPLLHAPRAAGYSELHTGNAVGKPSAPLYTEETETFLQNEKQPLAVNGQHLRTGYGAIKNYYSPSNFFTPPPPAYHSGPAPGSHLDPAPGDGKEPLDPAPEGAIIQQPHPVKQLPTTRAFNSKTLGDNQYYLSLCLCIAIVLMCNPTVLFCCIPAFYFASKAADTAEKNYDEALGYQKIAQCLNVTAVMWIAFFITLLIVGAVSAGAGVLISDYTYDY